MNEHDVEVLEKCYDERREVLLKIMEELHTEITTALVNFDQSHLDIIKGRVKTTDSFVTKACSLDENNNPKYKDPLSEVEDQIGFRIVVFFRGDLEVVGELIRDYFNQKEVDRKPPKDPSSFDYEAHHYICFLPKSIRKRQNSPIVFFELQIKTLFQHAWAQAFHDVGYKPSAPISAEDERLMHFAAAAAWGGDEIFERMNAKYRNN